MSGGFAPKVSDLDKGTLRAWQIVLETVLPDYLLKRYPGEMGTYKRFRQKNGPHCPICRSAAKIMFKSEAVARNDFLPRFQNNDWDGYV